MLTRRGWALGIGALFAAGAGRLFGTGEFMVMAVAGLALIVGSVAWTRTRRLRLRIQRSVQPTRVHAGGSAQVHLSLANLGGHVPMLRLTDPVAGTPGARLLIGPLLPVERVSASYLLSTQRRGHLEIGPTEVEIVDPLGLARARVGTGPSTTLVVYPATKPLTPLRLTRGPEPLGASADLHTLQRIGEDFYALRDYTAGDDVRRVHWPSTARLGRPMVREDEVPRRSRVTIVLDTRSTAFDDEAFELAVSSVASIALASATRHDPLRLVTVEGADSGIVSSAEGLAQLFDRLANVSLTKRGSLRSALATAAATSAGPVVLVLGGTASTESTRSSETGQTRDAEALQAVRSYASSMIVLRIGGLESHRPASKQLADQNLASSQLTNHQPDNRRLVDTLGTVVVNSLSELPNKWATAQASAPTGRRHSLR